MRKPGPQALSGLLLASGTLHFAIPDRYDPLIPPALPGPARWWTYGSGVAELGCAAAVLVPRSRRLGAVSSAWLFAGVFPGNLWMAWRWRSRGPIHRLIAYGRLPLQLPLIWWARRVGRPERPGPA
jgi:uncharacterized membrane protein